MSEQTKFSKAVVLGNMRMLQKDLAVARGKLDAMLQIANQVGPTDPTKHKKFTEGMLQRRNTVIHELDASIKDIEQKLLSLQMGVQKDMVEETSLVGEYDKPLIDYSIKKTREDVLKRLSHQPNISATIDMFCMLLETNMTLFAHFGNLRTQCAVEDRSKNNTQFYGLDGKPKNP